MEPQEVGNIQNEYFISIFAKEQDMINGEIGEGHVDEPRVPNLV